MSKIFKKYGTLIALFGIILLFSILKPSVFFTLRNFINITQQISILMIAAIGATFILGVSEFDLSLASTVSFGGVVAAGLMSSGVNWIIAIIISLAFSFIFGVMNGFLVSKLKLPSFVTTLATGTLLGGITFWYSGGTIIFSGIPDDFLIMGQEELLGIPITSLIMFGISFLSWFILSKTIFGRALYSTGGNEVAAKYSGIKVNKVKIIAFATSGVLSGFAGILLASKLGSAHPTAGGGYLMSAYAAAFLGTTLFKEGEANVWGTLVGALIMGIMANGLTILNTPYFLQDIITGIIIVAALILRVSKKA